MGLLPGSFPENTILSPGARLLLLRNKLAYEARYGSLNGIQWFEYTGRLSNDGETLSISDANLEPILSFTFNDQAPWPTSPDGTGPSLVLVNPLEGPDHGQAASWRASTTIGGSPGTIEAEGTDYATWAARRNIQGGASDDDDLDTISNFMEFLYGSDPGSPNSAPELEISMENLEVDGEIDDYLVITYQRNIEALGSLTVELSADLVTWSSDPDLTELLTQSENGNGTATVTVRLKSPVNSQGGPFFARLRGE